MPFNSVSVYFRLIAFCVAVGSFPTHVGRTGPGLELHGAAHGSAESADISYPLSPLPHWPAVCHATVYTDDRKISEGLLVWNCVIAFQWAASRPSGAHAAIQFCLQTLSSSLVSGGQLTQSCMRAKCCVSGRSWVQIYTHKRKPAVLTKFRLKTSIFWHITLCSPLQVNQRFGETLPLHLQSRRISGRLVYSCTLKIKATLLSEMSVGFQRAKSYPRNRPWRPIELWDVKDDTLYKQSAHRWLKVVSLTHQPHFTPQKHYYFF
jgi:hypothetical protein